MTTNGEVGNCDTTLPPQRIMQPEAIEMTPHSNCIYTLRSDGNQFWCWAYLTFAVSSVDTANALAYFHHNGLSLGVDDARIAVPKPGYRGGTGWLCPRYEEMNRYSMDRRAGDAAYRIAVLKDDQPVKEWDLSYRFDEGLAPAITVAKTPAGLQATFAPKPGTLIKEAVFQTGDGGASHVLNVKDARQTVVVVMDFRSVWFMGADTDSATLARENFAFCARMDSTVHAISLNGRTLPARSEVCQRVEGEALAWARAYRRKFCADCARAAAVGY